MKLSLGGYFEAPIQCHDLLLIRLLLFPFPILEVVLVHLRFLSLVVEGVQFQVVLELEVVGVGVQELSFLTLRVEVGVAVQELSFLTLRVEVVVLEELL